MHKWSFVILFLGAWLWCATAHTQDLRSPADVVPAGSTVMRLPPVGGGTITASASKKATDIVTETVSPPETTSEKQPTAADDSASAAAIIETPGESVKDVGVAPVKLWDGSFELGLNGTEGNSKTFSVRFGADANRKTPDSEITLDLDYRKTNSNYIETANKAFLDWRYEQLYKDSPWTSFVHGTVDYDEFQSFDMRVSVDLGLGYQFIKNDTTSLGARLGAGVSREIGSPDDTYVPEAVYGLKFEHRLSDRQKLAASAEYTPDMTGVEDFRLRSQASWELLIDKEMNLSLKFSLMDRYDSTPNGAVPNDLDYSAMLLWKY